jgi:hypothetical protein
LLVLFSTSLQIRHFISPIGLRMKRIAFFIPFICDASGR